MSTLPVEGWEREQVTYSHLIRPVVAFVRDHGPVPVERIHDLILTTAAGDLSFASPTKNRLDAARLVLNLLVQDIDVLTVTDDGNISVSFPNLVEVTSERFGRREIPSASEIQAQQDKSRRQRTLREWATRGLFRSKWRNGIRKYTEDEILWMMNQIEQYGYVGPKIVKDEDTGAILDGALRTAALKRLGIPVDNHSITQTFANDMHRLAYILAANTVPNTRTRIPKPLRDAILREVVPYGSGMLKTPSGAIAEPTPEDWLTITGKDFTVPESAKETAGAAPPVDTETNESMKDGTQRERILAVMNSEEWVENKVVVERLCNAGHPHTGVDRTIRKMVDAGLLERRFIGTTVEFRPRIIPIPESEPTIQGREKLPTELRTAQHIGLSILLEKAKETPDEWVSSAELTAMVSDRLNVGTKKTGTRNRAVFFLTDDARGTRMWDVDGEPWKVESKTEGKGKWLRAVRG